MSSVLASARLAKPSRRSRVTQVAVPLLIVAMIVLLVVPIPAPLLDVLLAVNLSIAVLILLTAMLVPRALEFSVFPALLLVTTLARLALNVTSTRLILTDGHAGEVISAFGGFVIGGNLVVGLVVFLILVVIQFAVITSGASRVSEVSARFTLDAMPGKQMAIDADLNAGLIDEVEARRRRTEISEEADFYGAMDGASKFVKGDAIAAVVLVVINLVAGFLVGVFQMGMDASEAVQRFSLLSVGDGLVSQIPALLISVASGLLVTRIAVEMDGAKGRPGGLGIDVLGQLGRNPTALSIAGALTLALGLLPGLPKLPFIFIGVALLVVAWRRSRRDQEQEALPALPPMEDDLPAIDPDVPSEALNVDPLRLDLAGDILDLLDPALGNLPSRVKALRRRVAGDLGIVVPPLRTADDPLLPLSTYAIRVNGVEVARGEAPVGCVLVLADDGSTSALPGRATVDPVFGTPAAWMSADLAEVYRASGSTVVDRASVIVTHLGEVVRQYADELLTRESVQMLLDAVGKVAPVIAKEIDGERVTVGEVQQVLACLLAEGVPVRNLTRILEAVASKARETRSMEALVETARQSIGSVVCDAASVDGELPVLSLDPSLEQSLLESVRSGEAGSWLAVDGMRLAGLIDGLSRTITQAEEQGDRPVLVCAAPLRPALRRLVASSHPQVPVVSYAELTRSVPIRQVGLVEVSPQFA